MDLGPTDNPQRDSNRKNQTERYVSPAGPECPDPGPGASERVALSRMSASLPQGLPCWRHFRLGTLAGQRAGGTFKNDDSVITHHRGVELPYVLILSDSMSLWVTSARWRVGGRHQGT